MTNETPTRPKCPQLFSVDFGRQLIEYLGGDPSPIEDDWCWKEFTAQYGKDDALIERAFEYFRTARDGNPAWAIYRLACHCGLDMEQAIEALCEMPNGEQYIETLRSGKGDSND